jgi:hypothetical protein
MLASLFAGAYAIRLRLRRSTGIERLQTMWLAWALGLLPIVLVMCLLSGLLGYTLGITLIDVIVFPLLLGIWIATSAAIGAAITRHGLYAIEGLVNGTLVYASLTTLLVGAYVGITVGLGVLVGGDSTSRRTATRTGGSRRGDVPARVGGVVARKHTDHTHAEDCVRLENQL